MFTLGNLLLYCTSRNTSRYAGFIRQKGSAVHTDFGSSSSLIAMVQSVIPPLTYDSYKGQCGRIGTVGGCKEYTGAPYFAAITVLKMGGDLSHVYCTDGAAPVIKSYSPELIVHPILDDQNFESEMEMWLRKMHTLVIGPGLGRHNHILENTKKLITSAMALDKPMVIDADGVFILAENPDLIKGYKKAIITPNRIEFKNIFMKVVGEEPSEEAPVQSVVKLSRTLGNVTIVRKGDNDIISDGEHVLVCCNEGSPRRCGGQGDLLSGSIGVLSYWAHKTQSQDESFKVYGPTMTAAYGGCLLTRECNRLAFKKHGRSTTTVDMIEEIQNSFTHLFQ